MHEGEDEELGTLRAGKEAGCFLVRRTAGERWCLLVRKDYRRRSDREYSAPVRAGERGLRRDAYAAAVTFIDPTRGRARPDARAARAAAKRTPFGRIVLEDSWVGREYETLERLWAAGARVPYPVAEVGHGFLMQYVGTLGAAAPRLADVRLDHDEATAMFERITGELRVLVREGLVHGDLSAYNVLVQHGRPWIIDLPQAVDLFEHQLGEELFERDVVNICRYFARLGVRTQAPRLVAELLAGDA